MLIVLFVGDRSVPEQAVGLSMARHEVLWVIGQKITFLGGQFASLICNSRKGVMNTFDSGFRRFPSFTG